MTLSVIDRAASYAHRNPSDAQKESGNYRKGHVRFQGLDIAIENAKGSMRRGVGPDGELWSVKLPAHYGYIKRTEGSDGDHIDVYIGPHHRSPHVYVIDQVESGSGEYDEHKVMLGFGSKNQAENFYCKGFSDGKGRKRIGHVATMDMSEFKDWLRNGDTAKPMEDGYARGGSVKRKEKRHTWDSHRRGPWDRKGKAGGGSVLGHTMTDEEVRDQRLAMRGSKLKDMVSRGRYAEGGAVDDWVTPDAAPADDWVTPPAATEPAKAQPTWSSAITEIPSEIAHAAGENWQAVKKAFKPDGQGNQGQFERLANTGKGVMGLAGVAMSPITGTARSLIGHPMAQLEHKAGELIAPEIAAKDDLRKMFETSRGDVDLALSGARPAGAPVRNAGVLEWDAPTAPVAAPEAAAAPANDVVAAAERASQVAPSPIEVPRAFASDSMAVQRAGQLARNVPVMGDSIPKATGRMVDQMGDTVKAVASEYGEGSGPNVANRISRKLADDAERETTAATRAAQESDDALMTAWQRDQDTAMAQIAGREENALEAARKATGDMSPQDMGEAVIARLRAGEAAAKARKEDLYKTAGETDAAITAESVGTVRSRAAQALDDEGRVVDRELTPASAKMMDELQRFAELNIENKAVGARPPVPAGETPRQAAVSIKGIEQVRKRLNSMGQAASNDADRAAAKKIMRAFDKWESDAVDNALFSGSPDALKIVKEARDANREWRQRFYNDRDDADKIINKVITGEVTPQEMSNWLVGASQIGAKGTSSRLLTRLGEITGNDPAAMNAIRGGVANRLFGTTEGVAGKAPAKTADAIAEFFNGSGRDVARKLFTPEQKKFALDYANTLRRAGEAREIVSDTAKMTKPSAMEVGTGPMEDLARSVLGRNGKTDEALFSAIDAYARSGARGDIKTLSDILRSIPEKDKGDLAGAIVRKLGQSKQTNDFSPELFASEWAKYTPQAKTVLLGNAGPHRQALDDLSIIAQRYKDVGRRFGNPSGTGQTATGAGALTWLITDPYTAVPSLVGGAVFAKMLSAPATARKAATLMKTSQALSRRSTPQKVIAFNAAANAFARSAERLGSNIAAADFMRLVRDPVPARAEDEKNRP